MNRTKKIAVYYRELPNALELLTSSSKTMSLVKDGVYETNGVRCPRATITLDWTGSAQDKELLNGLLKFLEELMSNNQIVSFSARYHG